MRIVVGDEHGVALYDLGGKLLERWSTTRTGTVIGALPQQRGVVVMSFDGAMRIVRPREDRVIGQVSMMMACRNEGATPLGVKRGRISADGRAACLGMNAILSGEIQVEITVDLATGKEYQHKVGSLADCWVNEQRPPAGLGCEAPAKPLAKTVAIEGETFTLASTSPTKRWELYEGPRGHASSYESTKILAIDTMAKQRYALEQGPWPAALSPGHKVTGEWASNPQIVWLTDEIAEIDQFALVELGKRVSLPGSFIRW